ncbi:MAG TPA: hypothetical protein VF192_07135 [Longimicrobiales bacterium]
MPDEMPAAGALEATLAKYPTRDAVHALCHQVRAIVQAMSPAAARWRMSIPVQPEDYDVVVWDVALLAWAEADELARLRAAFETERRGSRPAPRP